MKQSTYDTPYSKAVEYMYDGWASSYHRINEFTSYTADEVVAETARECAPAFVGGILDLATGTGFVLTRLRTSFNGAALTGLDLSGGMLCEAHGKIGGARLEQCNIETQQWPVPARSVDLVTCAGALSMIGNMDHVMDECRRVMAPGAAAVMSFQIRTDFMKGMAAMQMAACGFPTFRRNEKEMAGIVRDAGFEMLRPVRTFTGYKGPTFSETHGVIAFKKN